MPSAALCLPTAGRARSTWQDSHMQDTPEPLRLLRAAAAARDAAGLRRVLHPRSPGQHGECDLASNDYLGLAANPLVAEAAAAAAIQWGAGATGSRLVTGSTELHARLEHELATFCGAQAALVFSSGYLANLGAVTALAVALGSVPQVLVDAGGDPGGVRQGGGGANSGTIGDDDNAAGRRLGPTHLPVPPALRRRRPARGGLTGRRSP
jgi:hypothetical protein